MRFVRLVNKDSRPFDFHENQNKRLLGPGDECMVPWDLATSLFGDPFSVDTATDQARTRALKQSRGLFGYELGNMTEEEWDAKRPKIEVYDVETGERVYMVLDDPLGHRPPGVSPTDVPGVTNGTISALEAQLAATNAQVELLTKLLLAQQGETSPQGQAAIVSEDAPDQPSGAKGEALPPAEPSEDVPQAAPTGRSGKGKGTTLAPPPQS